MIFVMKQKTKSVKHFEGDVLDLHQREQCAAVISTSKDTLKCKFRKILKL